MAGKKASIPVDINGKAVKAGPGTKSAQAPGDTKYRAAPVNNLPIDLIPGRHMERISSKSWCRPFQNELVPGERDQNRSAHHEGQAWIPRPEQIQEIENLCRIGSFRKSTKPTIPNNQAANKTDNAFHISLPEYA